MTSLELNAELFRDLSIIAEDVTLSARLMKYIRRLIASKKRDETLMTREEFLAKLDKAEQDIASGNCVEMLPDESLEQMLRRIR